MIGFYGFDLFSLMFFLMFGTVFIVFITRAVQGFNQWSYNNRQPVLDVSATVVSKRTNITKHTGHTDSNGHHHIGHTSTSYYVTFELTSKDRIEFEVPGKTYGILIEGDSGTLKFQGTRFLDFNINL